MNDRLTEILDRLGKTATSDDVRHLEKRLGEVRLLSEKLEGASSTNAAEIERLKAQVTHLYAEVAKKADAGEMEEAIQPLREQRTRINTLWMLVQFIGFGGLAALVTFMGVYGGNKSPAPQPQPQYPAQLNAPRAPLYEESARDEAPPAERPRRRATAPTNHP